MRAFWAQAWPDPDEAQDLIEKELSDPRYQVPEPTWWDKFVAGIVDFLTDLVSSVASDAAGPYLVWIIAGVLVVLIIAAFFIWGRPRLALTSRATPEALFGDNDARTANELRAAADAAARAQNWNDAVVLRTRALARGLDERGIVVLPPGATVQQFAQEASHSFPSYAHAVANAARVFDNVRYVRIDATAADDADLTALDEQVQRARPAHLSALPTAGVSA